MAKSLIYTSSTTAVVVPAGSVVPIGTTVRRFGCSIRQTGDSIHLLTPGYYRVYVSATVTPTAASTVGLAILANGSPVTGGMVEAETTAAAQEVNLAPQTVVRVLGSDSALITVEITGAEATVDNISIIVDKA